MLFATPGCDSGWFSAWGCTQHRQQPFQPATAVPFLFHCWGKLRHGGTLPGLNTNCWRPTHVTALPFPLHCKTHAWVAAAIPLSSRSRRCRAQREELCPSALPPDQLRTGQRRARLSPLLSYLFLPAVCTERVQCSCMPWGPQPCPPGCVRAHTRAKKLPIISFTSAVPSSSSCERPHHLPNTRGVTQIHCLGSSPLSPHGEGWGAHIFPGGHNSFPAQLRNSRLAWRPRGLQRRRGRGQAGPGWTGEKKTTRPGTQGWDTRRDGKEPTSRAGWAS